MESREPPDRPAVGEEQPAEPPVPASPPRRRRGTAVIAWILALLALAAAVTLLVIQLSTRDELEDTREQLAATKARAGNLAAEVEELTAELDDTTAATEDLEATNQELREGLNGCRAFFRRSAEVVTEIGFTATPAEYQRALGAKGFRDLLACWGGKVPGA